MNQDKNNNKNLSSRGILFGGFLVILFSYFVPTETIISAINVNLTVLFLSLAMISSVMLSLVVSGAYVMVVMKNNKLMERLMRTGHYDVLFNNFFYAAAFLFTSVVFSFTSIFLPETFLPAYSITIANFVFCILLCGIAIYRFFILMNFISEKPKKKSLWAGVSGKEIPNQTN